MTEYIELLTKIKDAIISPTTTDGTLDTFKSIVLTLVLVALIACVVVVVSDNMSKVSKFFDFVKGVSMVIVFMSIVTAIIMVIVMTLHSALILNGLSKESKVSISNYIAELNDQEYSRLEKLVKLYGNQLSSEDRTIKQINKHLMETVGK